MRIVHLIQSAPEVYGAERCTLTELATLRRRGHDAQAVVVRETRMGPEGGALTGALRDAGIPVTEVTATGPVSPRLVAGLVAALRRLRPEVVHAHGLKADILGYVATRLHRAPLVVEVHGWLRPADDRRVRLYEALDVRVLRRCDAALVLSADYQAELLALGVPAARTHLLPTGLDLDGLAAQAGRRDLRRELGLPVDTPVAGIVARLSPEKGHADFLFALQAARARHTGPGPAPVGLVIGAGPLREALVAEAARLGLGDAVRWLGYVPEVADAYRALDVLVSCSRYEGLPLCLIEAMALSRPVLAMATGGCADIVADGETGVLVPRGDRAALAVGLSQLLSDAALRQRMGTAGLLRARARYSLDAWAEGAERIYRGLVTRSV